MGKKVRVTVDVSRLGRLGGQATARNRTPEERKRAAADAIKARWDAYYEKHPEKLAARKAREKAKQKSA